jgi:hypothetical protein
MTTVDSKSFLIDGGYLQKGPEINVREVDLQKKVSDLLPSRSVDLSVYLQGIR